MLFIKKIQVLHIFCFNDERKWKQKRALSSCIVEQRKNTASSPKNAVMTTWWW